VHGPPGLVEHEVAAAQHARLSGLPVLAVLAGVPVHVMSFCHGVCLVDGFYRVYRVSGVYGAEPAHPR